MSSRDKLIAAGLGLAGVVIFLFGPLIVRAVFPGSPSEVAYLEQLGNSYGAVNALFSGGALFVLALVFLHDRRNRSADLKRERKRNSPFVVPTIAIEGSTLQVVAAVHHPSYRLQILLEHWELATSTSSVALNVEVSATVRAADRQIGTESRRVDRPISQDTPYVGKHLTVDLAGDDARTAMERLCQAVADESLALDVRTDYEGVDGHRWFTKYSVELRATSQSDRSQLQRVIDREAEIGGPGERIGLEAKMLPSSWSQG